MVSCVHTLARISGSSLCAHSKDRDVDRQREREETQKIERNAVHIHTYTHMYTYVGMRTREMDKWNRTEEEKKRKINTGRKSERDGDGSICEHVSHMERPLYISATQLVTVYACNGASQFWLCRCIYARAVNAQRTSLKAAGAAQYRAYTYVCVYCSYTKYIKCTSLHRTLLCARARALSHTYAFTYAYACDIALFLSRHSFTYFSGTMKQ